jgi:hypothetical protein
MNPTNDAPAPAPSESGVRGAVETAIRTALMNEATEDGAWVDIGFAPPYDMKIDGNVAPSLIATAVLSALAPAASPSPEDVLRERVAELEAALAGEKRTATGNGYISADNGQGMGIPDKCTIWPCAGYVRLSGQFFTCEACGASYGSEL